MMEKVSEDIIVKTAHLMGVAQAMFDRGYSQEGVKLAFVQADLFPEDVAGVFVKAASETDLTKEAIAPAIIAGIASVGAKVAPWLARGAKAIGRFAGKTKGKLMRGGNFSQMAGGAVGAAGQGAGKVMKGMHKATLKGTAGLRQAGRSWEGAQGIGGKAKLLGSGAYNAGKGALFFGGKGTGGAIGRGVGYAGMGAGALGMMRGGAQPAQQMQQMYPQQRMYGG